MNLYAILGGLVVALLALWGAEHAGESRGDALRAKADQAQFDRVNGELTKQKATANALVAAADDAAIAKQRADAQALRQKEIDYENHRAESDAAAGALARQRLQFTRSVAAAGRGPGGGNALPAAGDAAGAARTETIELPDAIGADLRALVFDADLVADNYRKCYAFVYPEAPQPVSGSTWNPGPHASRDLPAALPVSADAVREPSIGDATELPKRRGGEAAYLPQLQDQRSGRATPNDGLLPTVPDAVHAALLIEGMPQ